MNNINSVFNESVKSSGKKGFLLFVVAILIILGLGVYYYLKILPNQKKQALIKRSGVPENFVLSDNFTTVAAPAPKQFPLASAEQITSGIQYQMPVSWQQATKQIAAQMQQQGWIGIAGSNPLPNGQLLKLGKGSETMIIQIVKGQIASSSQVTVYKIQHK
jgi:hypothetical protein